MPVPLAPYPTPPAPYTPPANGIISGRKKKVMHMVMEQKGMNMK